MCGKEKRQKAAELIARKKTSLGGSKKIVEVRHSRLGNNNKTQGELINRDFKSTLKLVSN